jgi:hypothetical protein
VCLNSIPPSLTLTKTKRMTCVFELSCCFYPLLFLPFSTKLQMETLRGERRKPPPASETTKRLQRAAAWNKKCASAGPHQAKELLRVRLCSPCNGMGEDDSSSRRGLKKKNPTSTLCFVFSATDHNQANYLARAANPTQLPNLRSGFSRFARVANPTQLPSCQRLLLSPPPPAVHRTFGARYPTRSGCTPKHPGGSP